MYRSGQVGYGASLLTNAQRWLPVDTEDAPQNSLVSFETDGGLHGPLDIDTAGLDAVLDVAGLFGLGDDFRFGNGAPVAALPQDAAGLNSIYPSDTDIDSLFATGTPPLGNNLIQCDGTVAFNIVGPRRLTTIT